MLATLTIELGAEARSAGSNSSVRRTAAAKLSSMWRRDVGVTALGELPAPGRPRVVHEEGEATAVLGPRWAGTRAAHPRQ